MMLCPYDAYCPLGEDSDPFGGLTEEDVSWAPVINGQNNWVGLGAYATCKQYDPLHPAEPAWGITGNDNEYITRHVMCCLDPSNTDDETPASSAFSSTIVESAVQLAHDSFFEDEFDMVYKMLYDRVCQNLKPVPHSRFSGWTGHTYIQALDFCNSKGSQAPCPYESLCPNGTGEQPIIDFLHGPVWSPITGTGNTWVEIHDQGQCTVQTHLEELTDVTRYVLCCNAER